MVHQQGTIFYNGKQLFLGMKTQKQQHFFFFFFFLTFFLINSPSDEAWEGGTFKLSLEFSEDYPNKAPKVKFLSKVFHPNGMVYTSLFYLLTIFFYSF